MKAKALLIGINYVNDPRSRLRGCVNDVRNVQAFLTSKLGLAPKDVRVYSDEETPDKTTAQGILTALYKLVAQSWEEDLDVAWFHYSGHGTHIRDHDGDEQDHQDECLVPSDCNTAGVITDDTVRKALKRFNPKTRVFCVFDCCHSGTIADLKYRFLGSDAMSLENDDKADFPKKVMALSGCSDHQTSADAYNVSGKHQFSGALTSCMLMALDENLVGHSANVLGLLDRVRDLLKARGFEQYPQLTASYDVRNDRALF